MKHALSVLFALALTARRIALPATLIGVSFWLCGCANRDAGANGQSVAAASSTKSASPESLAPGSVAPDFSYRLIHGGSLSSRELRGHPYMLWLMATWCSSCQGGATIIAQHIAELHAHGMRIVQLQAADNLGAPGPSMQTFQAGLGSAARSPDWYWGSATAAQMPVLDPNNYPDIYYLVNSNGTVAEANGSPAATWSEIEKFAVGRPSRPAASKHPI